MKKLLLVVLVFINVIVFAQPKHEFRGVWIATVANIDWPSKPGLSTEIQINEINAIISNCKKLGFNTIILQVRPCSDAFYESQLEPWSRYLSGTPGKPPKPFYDPLKTWINICHKNGLELHAWLNPFRVANDAGVPLAGNHVAFTHPDWVLKYGNKLYFDPGLPQTRDFVIKVVKDIVSRYDIDAIHFDDYFYPYPLADEFPDTSSFKIYNRGFEVENKADWRRENVNLLIEALNDTIKSIKPWVQFGISPFGVWRNNTDDPAGSATKAGATNYDDLYADVILWQKNGWIDYLLPQLYWRIGHPLVDFNHLTNWWAEHSYQRNLYIGQAVYKIDKNSKIEEWANPNQLPRQIKITREIPQIGGSAFFSYKHFKRDILGFADSLQNRLYKTPAISPTSIWLDSIQPPPVLSIKRKGKKVKWTTLLTTNKMDKAVKFVVYLNRKGEVFDSENSRYIFKIMAERELKFRKINKRKQAYEVRVSVLDRLNNESRLSVPVILKL